MGVEPTETKSEQTGQRMLEWPLPGIDIFPAHPIQLRKIIYNREKEELYLMYDDPASVQQHPQFTFNASHDRDTVYVENGSPPALAKRSRATGTNVYKVLDRLEGVVIVDEPPE